MLHLPFGAQRYFQAPPTFSNFAVRVRGLWLLHEAALATRLSGPLSALYSLCLGVARHRTRNIFIDI